MAVVNRTLDASEQRKVAGIRSGVVATGLTLPVVFADQPITIQSAQAAFFGISGSPVYLLTCQRFINGTGATVFEVGSTFAARAFGTSGLLPAGISLPATGSSLLNLVSGDVLMVSTFGSNAAVSGLALSVVLLPTQDIRTYFGLV